MTPHLVVRVDGDTYACEHSGDLAASLVHLLGIAMPDPCSTVHVATVTATDAGAARLAPVSYWIGTEDTDHDTVTSTARAMGFDVDTFDVDAVTATAIAFVAALAPYRVDLREPEEPGTLDPSDPDDAMALAICGVGGVE